LNIHKNARVFSRFYGYSLLALNGLIPISIKI
jgi:hypothetical protein